MNKQDSILFFGKANDKYSLAALHYIQEKFQKIEYFLGEWGDPFPSQLDDWQGSYVVSFLSRWIVPKGVLANAEKAAINFHPAPPEYPGVGCNNFALYDYAKEYGVTCHFMDSTVDTGRIIDAQRFAILESDTVSSLLEKTYPLLLNQFFLIIDKIASGKTLNETNEKWARKPYTRKELNALYRIEIGMTPEEIKRRVRATSYGVWKPSIEIHGYVFELKDKSETCLR